MNLVVTAVNRHRRLRSGHGEEGAILVLVLIFILVIGVTTAAVVTQAQVSLGNTRVVREKTSRVYVADAGVEMGIQRVRTDPTQCASPSGTPQQLTGISASTLPGLGGGEPATPTLTVTCQTLYGASSGALGWAIVTTDTGSDESLSTAGSTAGPPRIDGPVFAGRMPAGLGMIVTSGDAVESPGGGRCTSTGDKPAGLTVTNPFKYLCANPSGFASAAALAEAVPHQLPDWSTLPTQPIGPMAPPASGCSVFRPGKYVSGSVTSLPLTRDNYFASGVYYFENVVINVDSSLVTGSRMSVVAGSPGPDDTTHNVTSGSPTVACSTDAIAGVTDGSTGVTWILGRGSRIVVGTGNSQLEMFTRTGGASGTQELSIVAVPASAETTPPTWRRSSVLYSSDTCQGGSNIDGCLVYQNSGSNPQLSVQGLIWAPSAHLRLNNVTNLQGARYTGGIVAGRLGLQNSSSATGFTISVRNKPTARAVRIVARAGGGAGEGKVVEASAVVRVANDATATPTLESWRSD